MTGAFAATFAALYAAHQFGDHWVQTGWQAANKGRREWVGRWACGAHAATYTATAVVFLLTMMLVTGMRSTAGYTAGGLGLSAVSHYWIDRRFTLAAVAARLRRIGKEGFYQLGAPRPEKDDNPSLGTGAYALDQSAHVLFLFIAALIVARGAP